MSTVTDILKGLREVLLLQSQVGRLGEEVTAQSGELRRLSDDLIGLDKRLVRLETLIEMSGRGPQPPRIEG